MSERTTGATDVQVIESVNALYLWQGGEEWTEAHDCVDIVLSSAVPPTHRIVLANDVITPVLLEAIRELMKIAPAQEVLSNRHLDALSFAVRDTIWPDVYPETEV